jgi:hypothetical protein
LRPSAKERRTSTGAGRMGKAHDRSSAFPFGFVRRSRTRWVVLSRSRTLKKLGSLILRTGKGACERRAWWRAASRLISIWSGLEALFPSNTPKSFSVGIFRRWPATLCSSCGQRSKRECPAVLPQGARHGAPPARLRERQSSRGKLSLRNSESEVRPSRTNSTAPSLKMPRFAAACLQIPANREAKRRGTRRRLRKHAHVFR